MSDYDVAIIGAGLAGSAAAIRLSKAGKRVLLLEKSTGPHDKICGEFLNRSAQRHLRELGLDPVAQGAASIRHLRLLHRQRECAMTLETPGLSLSRRKLDACLLSLAAEAGATIRTVCTVTGLQREGGQWLVRTNQETFAAGTIFLATGKQDLRNLPRPATPLSEVVAFKMHYHLHPSQSDRLENHTELALFTAGYAGLEMVEEGKANLCLVLSKRAFQHGGKNWEGVFAHLSRHAPLLMQRLNAAHPVWNKPLAISGVPYGFTYREDAQAAADVYRLGDQMAVIPSFCGDGMSIALSSAELAVHHYLQTDAHHYHRAGRELFLPQMRKGTALAHLIANPAGQALLFQTCRAFPGMARRMQRQTSLHSSASLSAADHR